MDKATLKEQVRKEVDSLTMMQALRTYAKKGIPETPEETEKFDHAKRMLIDKMARASLKDPEKAGIIEVTLTEMFPERLAHDKLSKEEIKNAMVEIYNDYRDRINELKESEKENDLSFENLEPEIYDMFLKNIFSEFKMKLTRMGEEKKPLTVQQVNEEIRDIVKSAIYKEENEQALKNASDAGEKKQIYEDALELHQEIWHDGLNRLREAEKRYHGTPKAVDETLNSLKVEDFTRNGRHDPKTVETAIKATKDSVGKTRAAQKTAAAQAEAAFRAKER